MSEKLHWKFDNQRLVLQGVLDHSTAPALWQQRQRWLSPPPLSIDLTALTRIDSAGLALLLWVTENAQQQKITCQLVGATRELLSLIDIYHLQSIISPYLEQIDGLTTNYDNG